MEKNKILNRKHKNENWGLNVSKGSMCHQNSENLRGLTSQPGSKWLTPVFTNNKSTPHLFRQNLYACLSTTRCAIFIILRNSPKFDSVDF